MSLRVKLLLAQVPLAAALAFVGFVAVSNVSSLGRHSEVILKENYRSVLAAQRMREAIERLEDIALLSLVTGEAPLRTSAESRRSQFEVELRAAEGNVTENGEAEVLRELRRRWELYWGQFNRFAGDPGPVERRTSALGELEPSSAAVRTQVQALLDMNQDAMVRKSDRAQREARGATQLVVLATAVALLLGALLSSLATNRLLQPLELLARTVRRLSEGDFETRVDVPGQDEVAQLANDVNAMAMRLSQYRRSSLGELLLAQEASQAAIDSLPDPVVVFDLTGGVVNMNRAAEGLLGIRVGSGGAKPLEDVAPEAREALEKVRTHVLSGKGSYVPRGFEDAVCVSTQQGERYLLPHGSPVYSEEKAVTGAAIILQDVTRLRRVDDLRNNLVSTVAHEFRTPLTSLRMALHLSLEQVAGPLNAKQADLLYTAREECERLQALVDEVLDLARIQGGRIELHRSPCAPAALIETAIQTQRSFAEEHELVLQSEVLPGIPEVLADRQRIQLVLSNLVANAIRYTPSGGHITVRAEPAGDEGGMVRFEVADTGSGIPREYQASVFEKFVRVPGAPGGVGLGLSIAKDVVEAHGGQIGLKDTPGGGSTFWFTVPTGPAVEGETRPLPAAPAEN